MNGMSSIDLPEKSVERSERCSCPAIRGCSPDTTIAQAADPPCGKAPSQGSETQMPMSETMTRRASHPDEKRT